jgi:hypothetical protein
LEAAGVFCSSGDTPNGNALMESGEGFWAKRLSLKPFFKYFFEDINMNPKLKIVIAVVIVWQTP